MSTTLCAYILMGGYAFFEGRIRKSEIARSLETGQADRGSTRFVGFAFAVGLVTLLIAPILNHFQVGSLEHIVLIGFIGLVITGSGLLLRYWANETLGAFYSRT